MASLAIRDAVRAHGARARLARALARRRAGATTGARGATTTTATATTTRGARDGVDARRCRGMNDAAKAALDASARARERERERGAGGVLVRPGQAVRE